MSRELLQISRRQLFLLAGAARLARADQDFWNAKPPAEWNLGDIYQLVNHSPWAKPVRGFLRPVPAPAEIAPPDPVLRGRQPRSELRPDPDLPKGVVTWESSRAIRDALRTPLPSVFTECYVIGVDGIPLEAASTDDLMTTAALRSSGKVKWTVRAHAVRELVRASPVYALGFSRAAAPIEPDSGEVLFEAQFGRWVVESRFDPRKMLYRGQLAV